MTNHLVSQLQGSLLDHAVAKAQGFEVIDAAYSTDWVIVRTEPGEEPERYSPRRKWAHGGPIIEREGIAIWKRGGAWCAATHGGDHGYYDTEYGIIDCGGFDGIDGPTPLTAAMRAYVCSVFGSEVWL